MLFSLHSIAGTQNSLDKNQLHLVYIHPLRLQHPYYSRYIVPFPPYLQ